jgi:hypothetical protein
MIVKARRKLGARNERLVSGRLKAEEATQNSRSRPQAKLEQ